MADDLPCADFGLLGPLKRSLEYGNVRKRVADPKPIDAWRLDHDHFFVFELRPPADASGSRAFALFKMRWEDDDPVTAVTITQGPNPREVTVSDLRQPDQTRTVSLD